MKKKLLLLILPFFLISCGMNEDTDKVLMKNQSEVIGNISQFTSNVSKGEQIGKIKVDLEKEKGDKTNINLDYKLSIDSENKKSGGNLSGSIDGILTGTGKNSLAFNLDFVNTEKKLYGKLNKTNDFDIGSLIGMEGVKFDSLINKWVYLELPAGNSFDVSKYSDLLNIINKYQLFKLVKKNEDKEFYNYDITLNSDSMVNIANDYSISLSGSGLTSEDKKGIIDDLIKKPFKGNIKINPKNKQYFIFTSNMEKTLIKIENSKETFSFSINEEGNKNWFNLEFKKDGNIFNGTLSTKEDNKETMKGDIVLKLEKDNISANGKVDILEEGKANFDINISTNKDAKVNIEEPKDSKNFQEIIMQMMGLGGAINNLPTEETGAISNLTGSIEKIGSTVTGSIDIK